MKSCNNKIALSGRLFELDMERNRLTMPEFFQLAHAAGFSAVELRDSQLKPDASEAEIAAVMELSASYKLPVAMLTARSAPLHRQPDWSRFKAYLHLAQKLACPDLKICADQLDSIRIAAQMAADHGVRLGINNHIGGPSETWEGMLRFFEQVGHDNLYNHFDPSHLWLARASWSIDQLKAWLPRVTYVIMQDYREDPQFPLQGKRHVRSSGDDEAGMVGYPEICCVLVDARYHGCFGLVFLRDAVASPERLQRAVRHFFDPESFYHINQGGF